MCNWKEDFLQVCTFYAFGWEFPDLNQPAEVAERSKAVAVLRLTDDLKCHACQTKICMTILPWQY